MAGPFIRCAGGKRELAPRILDLMPGPAAYDTYVEPFLGGGAVYFALWHAHSYLSHKTVILGDTDTDLIALYAAVRDDVLELTNEASRMIAAAWQSGDAKAFYERERSLWNRSAAFRTPARHLFMRKACWNGLWRQNKKGEMNTPWRGEAPARVGMELLHAMAALRNPVVELLDWDFRRYETPEDEGVFIGQRTLVYLDPPYLGDADDFTNYTAGGWDEADLVDLLNLCHTWTERGAHVVLSHSDTALFRDHLASVWPGAAYNTVNARRSINSDGAKRGPVKEAIVVGKPTIDRRHVTLHSMRHGADA